MISGRIQYVFASVDEPPSGGALIADPELSDFVAYALEETIEDLERQIRALRADSRSLERPSLFALFLHDVQAAE